LAEVLPHELGFIEIERTRVGLFLGDADFRQKVDQDLGLDLEFAGQLVNADLIGI
jgi:hypothetical protein